MLCIVSLNHLIFPHYCQTSIQIKVFRICFQTIGIDLRGSSDANFGFAWSL